MARRFLILVVYVTQYTDVSKRSYGILSACIVIAIFHTIALPFRKTSENNLETLSLTVLTYAAGTKAAFTDGGEQQMLEEEVKVFLINMMSVAEV